MTTRHGLPVLLAPATATWAPGFAVYYMWLQQKVIHERHTTKTFLGDSSNGKRDGKDPLYVAIRSQGNFLETVPLALTIALLAELNGADRRIISYGLGSLLAMRIAHVEMGLKSDEAKGIGRTIGYFGTQGVTLGFAGYLVVLLKEYFGFD